MSDEELMAELQGGTESALQEIHRRYAPLIFATAARSLGPATADDIVQEVLLAVWNARASYDPARGRLRPWLLEIAHTRILNELRRQRRHPGDVDALDTVADAADGTADEAVWQEQRRSTLSRALAELPEAERLALRLAFFEDLSHREVADFLEAPLGTVKTRIRRGLGQLLRELAPVLGTSLLVVAVALWFYSRVEHQLGRHERAVRMLSLSDSQILRLTAASGVSPEVHGTFRWHPAVNTAVLTLSHAPAPEPGEQHVAWGRFAGNWVRLCRLDPAGPERELCLTEAPEVGQAPDALTITIEHRPGAAPSGRELAGWVAP